MLSQWIYWWSGKKKPLNSAIANNEPSLLKLQQALIGFNVMKKATWSIIIKVLCRLVRACAMCSDWQGKAPSIGARTGPCPWGNHPSTDINIWKPAAPEVFSLVLKYYHGGILKSQLHQPEFFFNQNPIAGVVYDNNSVYLIIIV